ncbi:MAG: ABC transporter ATP-binding protein, partial [Pseudomonadota bacterium]
MTQTHEIAPISAAGLSKRFGAVEAVKRVDLEVAPGQALGLLGPNGAGKSTTLSMLTGLFAPDAGEARIFGHPAGSAAARALTGATPQATGFPDQVTPREVLAYTAARYGARPDIGDMVARFGLERLIDRRIAGFSGGEMRRVALALAFVGDPKLVFLDEPTAGLDTEAQDAFRETARDYVAKGGALVLTSHQWDEIEAICDAIAVIDWGETVLHGGVDDFRDRAKVSRLSFALPVGAAPPGWLDAARDGDRWRAETADSDAALRRLVEEGAPFADLTLQPISLKDLIDRIRKEETIHCPHP